MSERIELRLHVTRQQLVRYAGASGDFNEIHFSDHFAQALGLDSAISHGMLTMGLAMRLATDWAGDPGRIEDCSFRFSRPVAVPDDSDGAEVVFTGTVTDDGTGPFQLAIVARCGEEQVGKGKATVRRG